MDISVFYYIYSIQHSPLLFTLATIFNKQHKQQQQQKKWSKFKGMIPSVRRTKYYIHTYNNSINGVYILRKDVETCLNIFVCFKNKKNKRKKKINNNETENL